MSGEWKIARQFMLVGSNDQKNHLEYLLDADFSLYIETAYEALDADFSIYIETAYEIINQLTLVVRWYCGKSW